MVVKTKETRVALNLKIKKSDKNTAEKTFQLEFIIEEEELNNEINPPF